MNPLKRLLRHLERRRLEKRWRRAYSRWDGRLEVQWPAPATEHVSQIIEPERQPTWDGYLRIYHGQPQHIPPARGRAPGVARHHFELAEWGETFMAAYSDGMHNGPRCTACGASFCVHCQPERMEERCNHADVQSVTETGPEVSPKPGGDPKSPEIGDAP